VRKFESFTIRANRCQPTDLKGNLRVRLEGHHGIVVKNNPISYIDPWGLCRDMYDVYAKFHGYNSYVNYHPKSDIPMALGVTASVLTKDYVLDTKSGLTTGRSSTLLGASVDFTFGSGSAEVGVGARNLGLGVRMGEGGVKGVSVHIGISLPPTYGYGSVNQPFP
jgi:hypothetical protein